MKTVYIIHGWSGSKLLRSWLKPELEARGYEVIMPVLPDMEHPKIENWLPFVQQTIKSPGADTIIVGHSMGGATLLRYLEALPESVVIGKAICVAPVINKITSLENDEERQIAEPWLTRPIDTEKVKRSAKDLVGFFSDDDPAIPLESEKFFREKYGRTIIEHGMRHYGGKGITSTPLLLEEIIK